METLFPLDFTGLGNTLNGKAHDYKVSVNEGVVSVLDENKFYTDGKQVFAIKNPKHVMNEEKKEKETKGSNGKQSKGKQHHSRILHHTFAR